MPGRHFLFLITIGAALLLGQGLVMNYVQALSAFVKMNNDAVRNGVKVMVQYQITLRDNPTTIYSATEEFVQGQHIIPYAIEQQLAGMQPREIKSFSLSAEEGFGPYDETKTQTIPTADLPLGAREGDIVDDDAGRIAKIVRIFRDRAVLDLNHPLAGQALMITLMIVAIEIPGDMDKNTVTGNGALNVLIADPGIDSVPVDLDLQHISTEDVPATDPATFCTGDRRDDFNPGAAATAMAL